MQRKRRLLRWLIPIVGFLVVGWLATWLWGCGDVQESRGLTLAQLEHRKADEPQWTAHSRAWSPLPFLVVVDWDRSAPPLHGHGERTTFVWFFGLNARLSRSVQWVS